jgi:hypothetical protein
MDLFHIGAFELRNGQHSPFDIDCSVLTGWDISVIGQMMLDVLPLFGEVEGVSRSGLRLAEYLQHYVTEGDYPLLIVDDVLTTGISMEEHRAGRYACGAVIFARGPCPEWVTPLFQMAKPAGRLIF